MSSCLTSFWFLNFSECLLKLHLVQFTEKRCNRTSLCRTSQSPVHSSAVSRCKCPLAHYMQVSEGNIARHADSAEPRKTFGLGETTFQVRPDLSFQKSGIKKAIPYNGQRSLDALRPCVNRNLIYGIVSIVFYICGLQQTQCVSK